MKKQDTVNTFEGGLIMDLNPLVTPNNVLTNCLNGTILTYNGNENVLQNDMGNGRVESAFLPEGYIPVGTTELGGIIYIVSYNPESGKCQIGSFPSPERNITENEITDNKSVQYNDDDFLVENNPIEGYWWITSPTVIKELGDTILNPGDKFIVCGNSISKNIHIKTNDEDKTPNYITYYKENGSIVKGHIEFKLATIDNTGKIIYLDSLNKYEAKKDGENKAFTNIYDGEISSVTGSNVDAYRKAVSSNYNIFTSRIAGKLYIVGQLEVIDSIDSVTWELVNISDTVNKENKLPIFDKGGAKYYTFKYTINYSSSRGNKITKLLLKESSLDDPTEVNKPGKDPKQYPILSEETENSITFNVVYKAKEDDIVELDIYPGVDFGYMSYLKQNSTIDLSLVGSKEIINNIWQYRRDSDKMSVKLDVYNYYSSNYIQGLSLEFYEWDGNKFSDGKYSFEFPAQKSYSGTHTLQIPFNTEFKPNSLYKVKLSAKIKGDGDSFTTSEINTHYMYTNGVFNDLYNSGTVIENSNFDDQYLPLKLIAKLNNIGISLDYQNVLGENSSLASLKPINKIEGTTEYIANGSKNFTVETDFENSFNNTFTYDQEGVIEITEDEKKGTSVLVETKKYPDQNDYNVDLDGLDNNNERCILLISDNKLKFNIKIDSPIESDTQVKEMSVTNYFAPLVESTYDLSKYGIELVEPDVSDLGTGKEYVPKRISLNMTPPALGISGGGSDNQGGGGIQYVLGIASYEKKLPRDPDTPKKDENEADYWSRRKMFIVGADTSQTGWKGGISQFPNEDMSKFLSENTIKGQSFVPVTLKNSGTSKIRYKNKLYYFSGNPNHGKDDNKQIAWFQENNQVSFSAMILFIKVFESDNYIPINHFFGIRDNSDEYKEEYEYTDDETNKQITGINYLFGDKDFTGLKQYYSLLTQLYAVRPFEGTVKVYTVNKYSYTDKRVTATLPIKSTVSVFNRNIKYNNQSLPSENKNCFKIIKEGDEPEITQSQDLKWTFIINNMWEDTFDEYKASSILPSYINQEGVKVPDNPNRTTIYVIDDQRLRPVKSSNEEIKLISLNVKYDSNNSEWLLVPNYDTKTENFSNLDSFIYDNRNDVMCLRQDKAFCKFPITFSSHKDGNWDRTLISGIQLYKENGVTNLPTQEWGTYDDYNDDKGGNNYAI